MKRFRDKLPGLGILAWLCIPCVAFGEGGAWLRPSDPDGPLIWGRTDGVVFGLPSPGGMRGPRGLIRVGIYGSETRSPELINFIAIEPATVGPGSRHSRMGFSELEPSQLDPGKRGKRLWVHVPEAGNRTQAVRGELVTLPTRPRPIERLTVRIEVEPFTANGAKVYVVAHMESDAPGEIAFSVYQHPDSAPVEELTLTATMGNYERLRYLWLRDRLVDSRVLYERESADGFGFMERENYPLVDMLRDREGDAVVISTTNEANPAAVGDIEPRWWNYRSVKLTQYWRVPAKNIQPDLRVKVNGRHVYWMSKSPIPGGTAFENFEVRERYVPGQVFIFGLTRKEPWQFQPPLPDLPQLPQE